MLPLFACLGLVVQGGSLRTWTFPSADLVEVDVRTMGRPMDVDVEVWNGPDNTPIKMRVYNEDGEIRPFRAVLPTPRGPNTVAVANIGPTELPILADVRGVEDARPCQWDTLPLQGGAVRTFPFHYGVERVDVRLGTDGRPLNARLELLQGPNSNKQVVEMYTDNGLERPVLLEFATPGPGHVMRVVNTAPVEFPMTVAAVPSLQPS